MLPILITLSWLAVVTMVMAACRTAAGADHPSGRRPAAAPRTHAR